MSIFKTLLAIGLSSALLAAAPGAFAGSNSKSQSSTNGYVGTGVVSNGYVGTGVVSNGYVGTGVVSNGYVGTGLNSAQGVCSGADSNLLLQLYCSIVN